MILTGQTIKGLQYDSNTEDSLTMKYRAKDADKILGNEDFGRDIRTLNEYNHDSAIYLIENELGRNISEFENQPIIIKL